MDLLVVGCGCFFVRFLAVAFKFFASHDVDDTELDVFDVEAGHVFDFTTDGDFDLLEDLWGAGAIFEDGFDFDAAASTFNDGGDAFGGFADGAEAGGEVAHEGAFHG